MSDTTNPIRDEISKAISEHEVILFMKGRPEQPMCGFSARTVAALDALGASYAAVDILPDPRIRQELSAISNWPTIPQLFVNGELVGGCDIVTEMYETGELATTLGHRPAGRAPRRRPRSPPSRAPRPSRSGTTSPRPSSSSLAAVARSSVAAGDGNEQPARRTEPAAARRRRGSPRRALRRHPRRHRRLRGGHRGRPDPRLQRRHASSAPRA